MKNIYPFTITCHGSSGYGWVQTFNKLWLNFFEENKEEINEKHGTRKWSGQGEMKKTISWYEVDLEILSPNTAEFHVYGMKDSTYGGRGDLEFKISVVFRNNELNPYILREQREIATYEYDERVSRLKEKIRADRIEAVRQELFTS